MTSECESAADHLAHSALIENRLLRPFLRFPAAMLDEKSENCRLELQFAKVSLQCQEHALCDLDRFGVRR